MFWNATKFLKSLKPGQIIKYHQPFTSFYYLFEFGHYEPDSNRLFWQTAMIVKRPSITTVLETASVVENGRIFEQKLFENRSFKNLSIAEQADILIYENEYDKYITIQWCEGKLQRNQVYFRPASDARLTRLKLAIDPPEYLYVHSNIAGECIFKSDALSYFGEEFCIYCKEKALVNDNIEVFPEGEVRVIASYENSNIREATDSERKLLIVRANDKLRQEKQNKKMTFSELLDTKQKTILYAYDGFTHYIFPYGGHRRIEGNELVLYDKSCYRKSRTEECLNTGILRSVRSFESLQILRIADEKEKLTYNNVVNQHNKKVQKTRISENNKKNSTILGIVSGLQANALRREISEEVLHMRPFVTKTLVCNGLGTVWIPALFGYPAKNKSVIAVGGLNFKYCIPYKKYKHLLGRPFEEIFQETKSD